MTQSEQVVSSTLAKGDGNLAYIDMLRGLAILGVLLVHSTSFGMQVVGLNTFPIHFEWLLLAGKHGVTLFFVVSAFTLMRSMHVRIDEEHMPIKKYFIRRFFRIAPAYYFVLLVAFFCYGQGFPGYSNPQDATLTWPDLAAHLLFVNSLFPFYTNNFLGVEWSVSTEFMFYILLPFLFLWLHKTSTKNQTIIKIGLLYFASIILYWAIFFKGGYLQRLGGGFASPVFGAWSYFFIATQLQAFVMGVAIWKFIHLQGKTQHHQTRLLTLLAGLVCVAIAGAYVEGYKSGAPNYVYYVWWGLVFWGLMSGAFIYVLNLLRPTNTGVLRVLSELGRVSFSLYLVHFPIFYGLSTIMEMWKMTPVPEINFILCEVVMLGLAYFMARLLYRFVELPGMELGRILIKRFSARKHVLAES